MMKKAISHSANELPKAERQVIQAYATLLEVWYESIDLEIVAQKAMQKSFSSTLRRTLANKEGDLQLAYISKLFDELHLRLTSEFHQVLPFLSESDSKYSIFELLADAISRFRQLLRDRSNDEIKTTKGKQTSVFGRLVLILEQLKGIRVNGVLVMYRSPLSKVLEDVLEEDDWDIENEDQLDYLVKLRTERERDYVLNRLPAMISLHSEQGKTKKATKPRDETLAKEKDLLFLLEQYEKWQDKMRRKAGKKLKLNSSDWYECFADWTKKTQDLFDKYSSEYQTGLESDKETAQALIRYAQKRRRLKNKREQENN